MIKYFLNFNSSTKLTSFPRVIAANLLIRRNCQTMTSPFPGFATAACHVGQEPEQWSDLQVVPPISTSTTYKQTEAGKPKRFDYGRAGNPTRLALETCLASLEGAKYCNVFASGLSASVSIVGMLDHGDHVLLMDDVYGGTNRYFRTIAIKNGVTRSLADLSDPSTVKQFMQKNTKMVWIESPTNPLMKVCDIAEVARVAKTVDPNVIIVVDNTFMTPYFQRPLTLGADIVVHSITKYINGHSDVVMGCVMTNKEEYFNHFDYYHKSVGAMSSPFDCYLVNRGIKTLHLRMEQHMKNGLKVAQFLEDHPLVDRVLYPELPSHPQYKIHKKQAKGMSGMMSFYVKGSLEQAEVFLASLKIFTLAESLGGYESLAEHPGIMTHASVPKDERDKLGISDTLVRLSVGIEDVQDLIEDLDQALKKANNK